MDFGELVVLAVASGIIVLLILFGRQVQWGVRSNKTMDEYVTWEWPFTKVAAKNCFGYYAETETYGLEEDTSFTYYPLPGAKGEVVTGNTNTSLGTAKMTKAGKWVKDASIMTAEACCLHAIQTARVGPIKWNAETGTCHVYPYNQPIIQWTQAKGQWSDFNVPWDVRHEMVPAKDLNAPPNGQVAVMFPCGGEDMPACLTENHWENFTNDSTWPPKDTTGCSESGAKGKIALYRTVMGFEKGNVNDDHTSKVQTTFTAPYIGCKTEPWIRAFGLRPPLNNPKSKILAEWTQPQEMPDWNPLDINDFNFNSDWGDKGNDKDQANARFMSSKYQF